MICVDENRLVWFLRGELAGDGAHEVEAHLDGCADCRELFGVVASSSLLSLPHAGMAPPHASSDELELGATVGRYAILERIGLGGMGIVYAAHDPQLDRKVALKLLRPDLAESLQPQLLAEARTLAQLSHPHVITVHDVGVHHAQVFTAMELVEGATLADWCNERRRAWPEIVAMFRQAGEGLAAAHAAGVIHRDFKPTNVRVGHDGRARVLDFGLALRISLPAGAGRGRELAGTPAYMAPEQVAGDRADARSDQFSFCVALYEALYGERPFAGLASATLAIRDAPRATRVPSWLRRVVIRGLAARPGDRFADLGALLARLAPHRRRRAALSVTVVLVLVAAAIGIAVGRTHGGGAASGALCRDAARKLVGIWDPPRRAAIRAAMLASGVTYAGDSWQHLDQTLTAYTDAWTTLRTEACEACRIRGEESEALLDRRMACLDDRLRSVDAFTTLLLRPDAAAVSAAVGAAQALPRLARCADARWLSETAPPIEQRGAVLALQQELARVEALGALGKLTEARGVAERAASAARGLGHAPTIARALVLLAMYQSHAGMFDQAQAALREAVLAAEAGHDDETRVAAWIQQANVVDRAGHPADGAVALDQAAAIVARIGGDVRLDAQVSYLRGALELELGQLAAARRSITRSVALTEQAFGRSSTRLAEPLQILGLVTSAEGNQDGALPILERMLALKQAELGPSHPQIADALEGVANVLGLLDRVEEAIELHRRALAIREQALGKTHRYVGMSLTNLSDLLIYRGDYAEAEPLLRRAHAVVESAVGPNHPQMGHVLLDEAELHHGLGANAVARDEATRAVAVFREALGPESPDVAHALDAQGSALTGLGRAREAIDVHHRALAILQHALGADHPDLADTLVRLGEAELAAHRVPDAIAELEHGLALYKHATPGPRVLATTRFELAGALAAGHLEPARARALAEAARADWAKLAGHDRDVARATAWLAAHRP